MKNKYFNNKTEEILNSLDGIKRAEVPDFFYTRLKAKIEKGYETGKRTKWIVKPVYALAALIVIIAVNAAIIFRDPPEEVNAANTDNEAVQAMTTLYNLNDNLIDDIN